MKICIIILFFGLSYSVFPQTELTNNSKEVSWDGKNTKTALKNMQVGKTTILKTQSLTYEAGVLENDDGSSSKYLKLIKPTIKPPSEEIKSESKISGEHINAKLKVIVSPTVFANSTTFTFKNYNGETLNLLIYNISGKVVAEYLHINTNKYILNKGSLPTGTYIYKVYDNNNNSTGKIIIKN